MIQQEIVLVQIICKIYLVYNDRKQTQLMNTLQKKFTYQQTEINNSCCCLIQAHRALYDTSRKVKSLIKKQHFPENKKIIRLSSKQFHKNHNNSQQSLQKITNQNQGNIQKNNFNTLQDKNIPIVNVQRFKQEKLKLSKSNLLSQTKKTLKRSNIETQNKPNFIKSEYYFELPKEVTIFQLKQNSSIQAKKRNLINVPQQQLKDIRLYNFNITQEQLILRSRKDETLQLIQGISQIKDTFNIPKSMSQISGLSQIILKIQNDSRHTLQFRSREDKNNLDYLTTPRQITTERRRQPCQIPI